MYGAWQVVKVTNESSEHTGRVGYVLRTEQKGDMPMVIVRLDGDAVNPVEVVGFDVTEIGAL